MIEPIFRPKWSNQTLFEILCDKASKIAKEINIEWCLEFSQNPLTAQLNFQRLERSNGKRYAHLMPEIVEINQIALELEPDMWANKKAQDEISHQQFCESQKRLSRFVSEQKIIDPNFSITQGD